MSDGARAIELEQASPSAEGSVYARIKPVLDWVLGVVLFVLFLPITLLCALAIRLDSPGPALFAQIRVGKDGRLFRFYKFRTMFVDARERFPELYRYEYSDVEIQAMRFKLLDDPRLTRFGRAVRRTSIDELPNFINVLKGEVSLVGPRPEIPEMLRYYRPDQLVKFSVRPGITGYAQVSGRGLLTFQETVALDLDYVRGQSLLTDLKVLLKTPLVGIRGTGAF